LYLLTRVDPDIFQTSSKTVVCVCVCVVVKVLRPIRHKKITLEMLPISYLVLRNEI